MYQLKKRDLNYLSKHSVKTYLHRINELQPKNIHPDQTVTQDKRKKTALNTNSIPQSDTWVIKAQCQARVPNQHS